MEKSSFFTSLNGDRRYKSEDFAKFFGSFIGNGVFPNPASNLQVRADSNDMTVTIGPGKAWIHGYMYDNTSDLKLTLGYPDGSQARIDLIVLRWDLPNREIKAYAKKGEFAEVPVAPTVTRNEDIYELALAEVYVDRNVMSIQTSDITDLRLDTSKCGLVTGLIEQVDTSELFAQIQAVIGNSAADIANWLEEVKVHYSAEFYAWFDTLRGSINDDVAGSLLNQILENKASIADIVEQLTNLSSTADKITLVKAQDMFTATNVDDALVEIMTEIKGVGTSMGGSLDLLYTTLKGER